MATLNFSITELCESNVARKYGINNAPKNMQQLDNMLNLIFYVLQPLRNKLGKPVHINSGFRCQELNSHNQIKGKKNSQHLTGCAADIRVDGCTASTLFNYIKGSGIIYDQLINEYDQWVHISFVKGNNRMQAFKL